MSTSTRLGSLAACAALMLCGSAYAAPSEILEQTSSFGALSLPDTTSFGWSMRAPTGGLTSADYFLSDYGFSIAADGSFSSAVVSFQLGSFLSLSDITLTLLTGTPLAGPVPYKLSASDVADRNARSIEFSTGDATTQTLAPLTLAAGNYTIEVRGRDTGSAGGSYGGVLNVANVSAVPEPSGVVLALCGAGLLGATTRRRTRR